MTDHNDHIDDAERRRQAAIKDFSKMRGKYCNSIASRWTGI